VKVIITSGKMVKFNFLEVLETRTMYQMFLKKITVKLRFIPKRKKKHCSCVRVFHVSSTVFCVPPTSKHVIDEATFN